METAAPDDLEKKSANRWWFDRHNNDDPSPKRSIWLNSTLSDLDEMTMSMLKIMDEDAESFGKRAEMYYRKRPELIGLVEEMYRSHRSLAVRFDQLKMESGSRLIVPLSSPFRCNRQEKLPVNLSAMTFSDCKSYDSYYEAYEAEESVESEIDDPVEEEEEEEEEVECEMGVEKKVREEVEKAEEEKKRMEDELKEKDEEKREVIRQLSMAVDVLKEENVRLRKKLAENVRLRKKLSAAAAAGVAAEIAKEGKGKRIKDRFFGKLFLNGWGWSPRTLVRIPL